MVRSKVENMSTSNGVTQRICSDAVPRCYGISLYWDDPDQAMQLAGSRKRELNLIPTSKFPHISPHHQGGLPRSYPCG